MTSVTFLTFLKLFLERFLHLWLIAVSVRKLTVYFQPFRRSLFLECALQPHIAKINKKNPYFKSSRSFKVIAIDMTEKLVTGACCDR